MTDGPVQRVETLPASPCASQCDEKYILYDGKLYMRKLDFVASPGSLTTQSQIILMQISVRTCSQKSVLCCVLLAGLANGSTLLTTQNPDLHVGNILSCAHVWQYKYTADGTPLKQSTFFKLVNAHVQLSWALA